MFYSSEKVNNLVRNGSSGVMKPSDSLSIWLSLHGILSRETPVIGLSLAGFSVNGFVKFIGGIGDKPVVLECQSTIADDEGIGIIKGSTLWTVAEHVRMLPMKRCTLSNVHGIPLSRRNQGLTGFSFCYVVTNDLVTRSDRVTHYRQRLQGVTVRYRGSVLSLVPRSE